MTQLLTREQFKAVVFERDKYKCMVCGADAVDAHHIIDRSLWDDGGYYADNGVSLCSDCHLRAEKTLISCEELREAAGIKVVVLPEHFYADQTYDHWGNISSGGALIKGELFHEPHVQKILKEAGVLDRFSPYVKYPRTYHLPWSPNLQNDDRQHENVDFFTGKDVVATIKMDGENTSMYGDYIHARSVTSRHHESRSWVKALHGRIRWDLPDGWRVCGENMYAEHSIHYNHLQSYFEVFSIWDENNLCLSWGDTKFYSELLGLHIVPVVYVGPWDRDAIEKAFDFYVGNSRDEVEGYVVRVRESFSYRDYRRCVAKYVRKNHVQTDEFWMSKPVVPNGLETE